MIGRHRCRCCPTFLLEVGLHTIVLLLGVDVSEDAEVTSESGVDDSCLSLSARDSVQGQVTPERGIGGVGRLGHSTALVGGNFIFLFAHAGFAF